MAGTWLDPRGTIVREPGWVIEVHHPDGNPADSVFAAIALEYCRRFNQEAVLRATAPARLILYSGSAH